MTSLFGLFLIAALLLITVGVYSLVMTHNLIRILFSVEIFAKSVTLMMIAAGYMTGKTAEAQTYIITIIVIEAMILVVATGIMFGVYKENESLDTRKLNNLRG